MLVTANALPFKVTPVCTISTANKSPFFGRTLSLSFEEREDGTSSIGTTTFLFVSVRPYNSLLFFLEV